MPGGIPLLRIEEFRDARFIMMTERDHTPMIRREQPSVSCRPLLETSLALAFCEGCREKQLFALEVPGKPPLTQWTLSNDELFVNLSTWSKEFQAVPHVINKHVQSHPISKSNAQDDLTME